MDAHKNFAYSTVATAPSPATSGTSLVVAAGDGSKFPATPFNATVWPADSMPTTANAEIVRVTGISGNTFTIVRAQESSSARSIGTGDQIAATITAKTLTDVESALTELLPVADVTGVTLDTTTYDNPVTQGPDKIRVLVFPNDPVEGLQALFAVALEGDAFPRQVWFADPTEEAGGGVDMGDGTTDPWNEQSAGWVIEKNPDGSYQYSIIAAAGATFGLIDDNGEAITHFAGLLRVDGNNGGGGRIRGGSNAPTCSGDLNDLYVRNDAPDGSSWLYRCTTAGDAGSAVWEAASFGGSDTLADVLGRSNNAGGLSIANLADPTNPQDAATKAYSDLKIATTQALALAQNPPNFAGPYNPMLVRGHRSPSANFMHGMRVTIPKTGTLHDLTVYIGTSSGNLDIGIYDTTATTRNRLYHSGSVASPGTGWKIIGDPALSVTAGDQLDFTIAVDNGTITIGYFDNPIADMKLPAGFYPSPLGGTNKLVWFVGTSFPLPSTVAESSLSTDSTAYCVIGRIT